MRFQLSTCLLLVALLAVSLAWMMDRSHFDSELEQAIRTQELVDHVTSRTKNAAILPHHQAPDLETPDRLLVVAVAELFEWQEHIMRLNEMRGQGETASQLANSILSKLNIDSTDDYFTALSSFNVQRGKFADYTNRTTERHKFLCQFVNQSLPATDDFTKAARRGALDEYAKTLLQRRTTK